MHISGKLYPKFQMLRKAFKNAPTVDTLQGYIFSMKDGGRGNKIPTLCQKWGKLFVLNIFVQILIKSNKNEPSFKKKNEFLKDYCLKMQ